MFSSCYHMGDLFVLSCNALVEYVPFSSIISFLLGLHLYPKTCGTFLPQLGSSSGLHSWDQSFLIMRGFSQIALISLPSLSLSFCLLLSFPFLPPSLQISMSARSTMEAASTDVLTPGAPTTVNATQALACMWTAAPASVRNITATWQCIHRTS